MDNIKERLREFITEEFNPGVELTNESRLIDQGIIDSMAILIIIGFIEEVCSLSIDPEDVDLANFKTIDAIADLIKEYEDL